MLKCNHISLSTNYSTSANFQKTTNFLIKWFARMHHPTMLASNQYAGKSKSSFKLITVYTNNLIKPFVNFDINWSSGMLSKLLFKFDVLESQKYSSPLSARKDWSLWKFIYTIWWSSVNYHTQKFYPWSIRIRRFFKYVNNLPIFTIIGYSFSSFTTPKKRIKRWLKKKYTTHSWR